METRRAYGVAGALDHAIVREIAPEIESLGFSTFWSNDTPVGDGLASLAAAAAITNEIRLGVGVIPVDRLSATQIIDRVENLDLPVDRLVVGIGAGGTRKGSIELVRSAIETLHRRGIRTVVGALGPRMVALSASDADGALLSWLTPAAASQSVDLMRASGSSDRTEADLYIRVAFGDAATPKLEAEALRYESFPQYAAHFERMGVRAIDTTVFGPTEAAIQAGLAAYDGVVDELVTRAIVADETASAYLELARAAAPNRR
jgi:alkanesulfonate monooxygenase SsuD/methylene tetrahydromethanopterin reductase-like flavin-dependent oxidoreductase (luciferase family)